MGQSMTMRRKLLPNDIEMHNLYFSQRFRSESGRNSWKVSMKSIYYANQYNYDVARERETQEEAFVFPPKDGSDAEDSDKMSFSIWN